ncbi:porin [Acuticoccus mangrovi]|uniref:Porin n=1 Tax=Acuticoccus mangrovi TaxID=2796142 RepID=A0A934MGH0_9HYPH|nr:porin [Acuticoccus mangrovi]MBJ3774971.1 porin [Acuticoccus mangrovi]
MNIKRLVLGTAAGALAVTGAQAADLPVVVEPIDYVRICDAYGTGFYYIPGTETCLRVAGRIRADYNVFFDPDDDDFNILGGYSQDGSNGYRFRARAYLYMDSRTNTEFGLLRTFTEIYWTSQFGGNLGVTLNNAFIQFGGLTFGRTQSFYDFLDASYGSSQLFTDSLSDTKTNLAAYTFAFGNGFSATLSLEDELTRRYGIQGGTYQGSRIPDIVGALRVDQGWGSAQLMAAGHYVEDIFSDSKYGFAIGAGVNVNVPFGNGTQVGIQGGYSQGALNYTSSGAVAPYGPWDATVGPGGNLNLVDAFNISGGFSTSFTPTVSLGVQVGYMYADYGNNTFDVNGDGIFNDDLDFSNFDVDAFLGYSPVAGFVLGLGAQFKYVDTADAGSGSALSAFFRAQRSF